MRARFCRDEAQLGDHALAWPARRLEDARSELQQNFKLCQAELTAANRVKSDLCSQVRSKARSGIP